MGIGVGTCVQVGPKRRVDWFRPTDGQRYVIRHPLNGRKTGALVRQYTQKILEAGIVEGVRGEAWLVYDQASDVFLALTFGTLRLSCTIWATFLGFCSATESSTEIQISSSLPSRTALGFGSFLLW